MHPHGEEGQDGGHAPHPALAVQRLEPPEHRPGDGGGEDGDPRGQEGQHGRHPPDAGGMERGLVVGQPVEEGDLPEEDVVDEEAGQEPAPCVRLRRRERPDGQGGSQEERGAPEAVEQAEEGQDDQEPGRHVFAE